MLIYLVFQLMYKQRLFMTTVPKLVEGFHAAPSGKISRSFIRHLNTIRLL